MNIVFAGGTGFLGRCLTDALLRAGHRLTLLTRDANAVRPSGVTVIRWDGKNPGSWCASVAEADAVLNFAGEPMAGRRWTRAEKRKILESRIDATRAIVSSLAGRGRPAVLVNASAVGFYGSVPEGSVTEEHAAGSGFVAEVCQQWEEAARAAPPAVRVVILRMGVVLGRGGGALQKMIAPFRFFAGGTLGTGKQWLSWVHVDDVAGAVLFALNSGTLHGPVNVTAPKPVTMKSFALSLGKILRRPSWTRVPGPVLRLIAGETAGMLLTGQCVVPARLLAVGYRFRFPDLEHALRDIIGRETLDVPAALNH